MKKYIFVFLFLILGISSQAQIIKFKAEYMSMKIDSVNWTPWEESSVVIVVNLTKENINIYSIQEQEYTIISTKAISHEDDKVILYFDCIDELGIRCTVEFVAFKDKPKKHLYIRRKPEIVYQMDKL